MSVGRKKPVRIVFRADASIQIGTGHVMRCLTLADELRARGAECQFIFRPHIGSLLDQIVQRGHEAAVLPSLTATEISPQTKVDPVHAYWLGTEWSRDADDTCRAVGSESVDWMVVDHYALDARWEQALRHVCRRLMVIDDLADRPHICDLLLDQNLGRTAADYSGLVPISATKLIGSKYALLRPEFAQLRAESLARRSVSQLKRILITMGGVDESNTTARVLDALNVCALPSDLRITAVMGSRSPWLQNVSEQALKMRYPTQVLAGVTNMAQLMADSDLAIGAAGGTSWERCCLGLPSIVLALADNQIFGADILGKRGLAVVVRSVSEIQRLFETNSKIIPERLKELSRSAARVTDGLGTRRVAEQMMSSHA